MYFHGHDDVHRWDLTLYLCIVYVIVCRVINMYYGRLDQKSLVHFVPLPNQS